MNLSRPCSLFYRLSLPAIALAVFVAASASIAAPSASEAVKQTADGVLEAVRDPKLKSNREARRERIQSLLRARFDFEEMAKRALGPYWSKQKPEDQRRFVEDFSQLLINTYSDRIEEYQGEKITYGRERQEDGTATVESKIQDQKGQEHTINYRSSQKDNDWKVYDVVIDDISIVNNYRSQFSRLLNKGTFADLLQALASKRFQEPGRS
jgi:phospholipid transport system substrate-binding protein